MSSRLGAFWVCLAALLAAPPALAFPAPDRDELSLDERTWAARLDPGAEVSTLQEPILLQPRVPAWGAVAEPSLLTRQLAFSFEARIPGSVVVRYEGIEGYVVRQLRSRLRSTWHRRVRREIHDAGPYDPSPRERMAEIGWALRDHEAGGRWWERSWFHSLPAHKGGAPDRPFVHVVGRRVTWRLGPVSFSNDLRIKVAPVAELRLEPGAIGREDGEAGALRARDHAHLGRADDEAWAGLSPLREAGALLIPDSLDLVLTPEAEAGLVDGLHCRLRVRPRAKVGLGSDLREAKGELSVRADLDFLLGSDPADAYSLARLKADVRYRPLDGDGGELLATAALIVPW